MHGNKVSLSTPSQWTVRQAVNSPWGVATATKTVTQTASVCRKRLLNLPGFVETTAKLLVQMYLSHTLQERVELNTHKWSGVPTLFQPSLYGSFIPGQFNISVQQLAPFQKHKSSVLLSNTIRRKACPLWSMERRDILSMLLFEPSGPQTCSFWIKTTVVSPRPPELHWCEGAWFPSILCNPSSEPPAM